MGTLPARTWSQEKSLTFLHDKIRFFNLMFLANFYEAGVCTTAAFYGCPESFSLIRKPDFFKVILCFTDIADYGFQLTESYIPIWFEHTY